MSGKRRKVGPKVGHAGVGRVQNAGKMGRKRRNKRRTPDVRRPALGPTFGPTFRRLPDTDSGSKSLWLKNSSTTLRRAATGRLFRKQTRMMIDKDYLSENKGPLSIYLESGYLRAHPLYLNSSTTLRRAATVQEVLRPAELHSIPGLGAGRGGADQTRMMIDIKIKGLYLR